jgi:hypothetical protein
MGRTVAVFQSGGIQPDLNDCCIKSEAGVDRGYAQFFRTLAVMKSGPEDFEIFSFFKFFQNCIPGEINVSYTVNVAVARKVRRCKRWFCYKYFGESFSEYIYNSIVVIYH